MQVISTNSTYASGGKRFLAYIIDRILLHAVFSAVLFRWWWGFPFDWGHDNFDINSMHFGFTHMGFRFWEYSFLAGVVTMLYFSLMESSKYQATLGKIVLGIKVTDVHGAPITFPKALLRNLSKYLSAFILWIGYIMILFDERKQGLHDKIADTLVVNQ